MASNSGFFTGDKKKKKKSELSQTNFSAAPVFVPPRIIPKGKKEL